VTTTSNHRSDAPKLFQSRCAASYARWNTRTGEASRTETGNHDRVLRNLIDRDEAHFTKGIAKRRIGKMRKENRIEERQRAHSLTLARNGEGETAEFSVIRLKAGNFPGR